MTGLLGKLRRALRKDPRYIARRLWLEAAIEAERWRGPPRARSLDAAVLARRAGYADVDALWSGLAARPYAHPRLDDADALERLEPGTTGLLLDRARRAQGREVELLGSEPVVLSDPIDWHQDFKTGHRWPPAFHRRIDYNNFDRPSDVKLPWELSRLQWALPLGQAWLLTKDDAHAAAARALLESWIDANPYGASVNWACTMEPALRILSWTWLFHACADAPSWRDTEFRSRFIGALYLHGDFVARNLERADINGNHYTADAAGLVYAGLFFGPVGRAPRWAQDGWRILLSELPRQVFPDGVDYEASVAYHRLVLELFAYPALYRMRSGLPVDAAYCERLAQMARFTAAYSRQDGSVPLWGDADDARALPLGTQTLNDHRYLIGLIAAVCGVDDLLDCFSGRRDEVAWALGMAAAERLPARAQAPPAPSIAFPDGGFYILRSADHHVFVDCGPLGLAGRGGHGHNDLLSFEAVLHGEHLLTDCGAFVYSGSPTERNNFRSTAYHNTPQVDGEEINRLVAPQLLWVLHNDAPHRPLEWTVAEQHSTFVGSHAGYTRLPQPVSVERQIRLEHATGTLCVVDRLVGAGEHGVTVPWHFAPGVRPQLELEGASDCEGRVLLHVNDHRFELHWQSEGEWTAQVERARVSRAYGVVVPSWALKLRRRGPLRDLQVTIAHVASQGRSPS
jgi:uncharacterized heparinase superfamily protein